MTKNHGQQILNKVKLILKERMPREKGNLYPVVDRILKYKKQILKLTSKKRTPFYIFDQYALDGSIESFLNEFKKAIPSFKAYYAMKINHHPYVVERVLKKGMGIDAASPREIEMAIEAGCKDILYFSPGKTDEDLLYALKHSDIVTINMDSFGELNKLGRITNHGKKKIKAGIRIHTDSSGDWKKYGIHIRKLKAFWEEAQKYPYIDLQGVHFHMSRNKDASFYEKTIKELGEYLKYNFNAKELKKIRYVDFGGGFEVYKAEGYYPFKTPQGSIIKTANSFTGDQTIFDSRYYILDASRIKEYAKKIGGAIKSYLTPIIDAAYYSEPGRVICNDSMYIVLAIADKKDKDNVVLDGGVNMVGWQRFEHEYFPLINISSPSKKEMSCYVWGNLCTTWDIWGYSCYAKKLQENDIIIVPNQGALTYSLAQNFIQPIPPVYKLKN